MADGKNNSERDQHLAPLTDGACSPQHDAWMKTEIRKTLEKKQAGTMTYQSLEEVMRKFGFDAR